MRAKQLSDLLKKGDRVAVSNITGREASQVTGISQKYCANIIGGWALGKGGQTLKTSQGSIRVFATFEELLRLTPKENHPNKILIYSPPDAVYGEVKEILKYGAGIVDTLYIITEHVSVEVTAKIYRLCLTARVNVVGCNTLGIINVHDHVRIGAVGGDSPEESFKPGSVTIISNSGNMVNTISSYLASVGMQVSFGISTGKDRLILFALQYFLMLAEKDENTKIIVLYIEPGGTYEAEAIAWMRRKKFSKSIVVYVGGAIAEKTNVSLGHAGAVVDGKMSSAGGKKALFDDYFGIPPFDPTKKYRKISENAEVLSRGIRVNILHHIPLAVDLITQVLHIPKDSSNFQPLKLNPWFSNLRELGKELPAKLSLSRGNIPEPYKSQYQQLRKGFIDTMVRQPLRGTSRASANDGAVPRIYGYSLMDLMQERSFIAGLILYWTGSLPRNTFEERLAEMTLTASLTNGPGTISAQGAKLSASAGNRPHTAMIGTLASIGTVHGGNGAKAVSFLLDIFSKTGLINPYDVSFDPIPLATEAAAAFKKKKDAAKAIGLEYERIPCLGHPVFSREAVNYDPREQVIYRFIEKNGKSQVFLKFYHALAEALRENGATSRVMAVNVDAAIACVWLGLCWKAIVAKEMTTRRAMDIPFAAFALGRAAGGAGEFLDHQDYGTPMDMRIPVQECRSLTRPRDLTAEK
ncbi:MAG: hypothetical protein HQ557_05630 [Bacteroidetes bacterium]|nr:hypothetical protein [Bacteroidota bacterium]